MAERRYTITYEGDYAGVRREVRFATFAESEAEATRALSENIRDTIGGPGWLYRGGYHVAGRFYGHRVVMNWEERDVDRYEAEEQAREQADYDASEVREYYAGGQYLPEELSDFYDLVRAPAGGITRESYADDLYDAYAEDYYEDYYEYDDDSDYE
jgi:hypothetical protein